MTTIGKFNLVESTYIGYINTLQLKVPDVRIAPAEKATEDSPDFRVTAGNAEIGAAWKKIAESGTRYLSVQIDDPSLSAPFPATLFEQEDGSYNLVFSRNRR